MKKSIQRPRARHKVPLIINPTGQRPSNVTLEAPEHLCEIGRAMFSKIAARLQKTGTLGEEDAEAIELFAAAYAEWRQLEDELRGQKTTYESITTEGGMKIVARPEVMHRADAWSRCERLLPKLLMVPVARKGKKTEAPKDPMAEFVN